MNELLGMLLLYPGVMNNITLRVREYFLRQERARLRWPWQIYRLYKIDKELYEIDQLLRLNYIFGAIVPEA